MIGHGSTHPEDPPTSTYASWRIAAVGKKIHYTVRSVQRRMGRLSYSFGGPRSMVALLLAVAAIAVVIVGLMDMVPGSRHSSQGYDVPELMAAYVKYLDDKTNNKGRLPCLPHSLLHPLLTALTRFIPTSPPHMWGNASDIYTPDRVDQSNLAFLMPLADPTSGQFTTGCWRAALEGKECVQWMQNVSRQVLRRDPADSGAPYSLNYLFMGFWGWFNYISPVSGTFSTHNTLQLTQLYGDTPQRQAALRTAKSGKMKTSTCGNNEVCLPLLKDLQPDFTMVTNSSYSPGSDGPTPVIRGGQTTGGMANDMPSGSDDSPNSPDGNTFASGDPNANVLSGKLFWTTMFVRLHNHMCDLVQQQRPDYTDEQVFQNARLLIGHVVAKIVIEDVVSNVLSPLREYVQLLRYNPNQLRTLPVKSLPWHAYWEHKLWTTWYSGVPSTLVVGGLDSPRFELPFKATIFWPSLVSQFGPRALGQGAYLTPLHPFGAGSIPGYFSNNSIALMAMADVMGLRYNDYLQLLGLPRITTFSDLLVNSTISETLSNLYSGSVDNLDMPVGMWIQGARWSNSLVSEPMLIGLMGFTLSSVLNLQIIQDPHLFSEEAMTPLGKKFVLEFNFSEWVGLNTGIITKCPFFLPGTNCDFLSLPEPSQAGRLANLGDFVFINMQALEGNILHNPDCLQRQYLLVFVLMLSIVLAFILLHCMLHRFSRVYRRRMVPSRKLVLIINIIMALAFLIQIGPYSKLAVQLLIGPDALATMNGCCVPVLFMPLSHALLFSVQAALVVFMKRDPLMMLRRVGFGGMMIIAISSQSFILMKVALVLDYFLLHKVSLYLIFILQELRLPTAYLLPCMAIGLFHYVSTRLLQMVVLIAMFVMSVGKVGGSQLDFYGAAAIASFWIVVQWQDPVSLGQTMQRLVKARRNRQGKGGFPRWQISGPAAPGDGDGGLSSLESVSVPGGLRRWPMLARKKKLRSASKLVSVEVEGEGEREGEGEGESCASDVRRSSMSTASPVNTA